jgi:hypothetical protein
LATPNNPAEQKAMRKLALSQAIIQMEMLIESAPAMEFPERVVKAAMEFRDALKEFNDAS